MSATRPVAAQYCATFLKPEMLHIYRQITGLRRYRPVVFAQKRENAEKFPFDDIRMFPRPSTQWLRRWWVKQVCGHPLQIETGRSRAIIQELAKTEAKLVHVYFGHMGVFLLPFIEMSPVPVVLSFHGADAMVDLEKPRFRKCMQRVLQIVNGVLVRSNAIAAQLQHLGCPPEKLYRHRTGIPLDLFPYSPRQIPPNGEWHFVQACRLIEKKGLPVSLRAFARFAEVYPASHFTIAGDGALRDRLQQIAESLGVGSKVTFTGFLDQEELRKLFQSAHFFLHPSETGPDGNQEGVPNSMLEAMATGLPTLATRHGGIPEAIEDGKSGILVSEGDGETLSERLLALAGDPQRYESIGKAGSEAVREKFELRAQVNVLEEIYDQVLTAQPVF